MSVQMGIVRVRDIGTDMSLACLPARQEGSRLVRVRSGLSNRN